MAAKPKPKKKPATFDTFFRAIQEDLFVIRKEMATKEDIRAIRGEMANLATRAELREVRDDVKRVTDMMVSKADLEALREELLREIKDGKHIDELRERLVVVERKLGIEKSRRAA
jgi:hypothetical protein